MLNDAVRTEIFNLLIKHGYEINTVKCIIAAADGEFTRMSYMEAARIITKVMHDEWDEDLAK